MYRNTFKPYSGDILPALDPTVVPKSLHHRTTIEGTFNDESFKLVGGGDGQPHEGIINCRLDSQTGPAPFPMPVMNVIAIFGLPTYSKHINVFDIFKRSDGYEYERFIDFGDRGKLHSLHHVRYDEASGRRLINAHFSVEARVDIPKDIVSLDPILETFVPAGPGRVRSTFILSWQCEDGSRVHASCESEYRLRHGLELPYRLFRSAEFVEDRSTPVLLDLDERIWVTDRLEQPLSSAA